MRCPTRRAFTGASAVTLTCETCGDASASVESFRHLSLEIPPLRLATIRAARAPGGSSRGASRLKPSSGGARAPAAGRARRWRGGCSARRARCSCTSSASRRRRVARDVRPRRLLPSVSGDSRGCSSERVRAPRLTKDARPITLPETVTLAPFADAAVRGPPRRRRRRRRRRSIRQPRGPDLSADGGGGDAHVRRRRSAAGEAARAQLASYRLAGCGLAPGGIHAPGHYVASARGLGRRRRKRFTAAKRWMSFDDERASFAEVTGGVRVRGWRLVRRRVRVRSRGDANETNDSTTTRRGRFAKKSALRLSSAFRRRQPCVRAYRRCTAHTTKCIL